LRQQQWAVQGHQDLGVLGASLARTSKVDGEEQKSNECVVEKEGCDQEMCDGVKQNGSEQPTQLVWPDYNTLFCSQKSCLHLEF